MKKLVIFTFFLVFSSFAFGQNNEKVLVNAGAKEVDKVMKIISFEDQSITLNINQKAKIFALGKEKEQEKIAARSKGLSKKELSQLATDLNIKYEAKIVEILTPRQRVAFFKNKDKHIQWMPDMYEEKN